MDAEDDKYPEILSDLRDNLAEILTESGMEALEAKRLAAYAAERVREQWSGMSFYIPKARDWMLSKRDNEIYRRFNGENIKQLCREYGLSEQRLYQVIARVRAAQIAKRQHRIPGF